MKQRERWVGLLLLLLLFSLADVAVAEEKLFKESWYLVEQEKKLVGYECDQIWQTETGYRYQQVAMLKTSMLESNPVMIKCEVEMQVDQNYLAKSFSIVTTINQVQTKINGKFSKKSVRVVTKTSDGKETVKEEVFKNPIYFEGSFVEHLVAQGKLKVGKKFNAQVFDLETLTNRDYQLKVEKQTTYTYQKQAVKVCAITTNKKGLKFLMDATGETYWGYDPVQKFTIRKVEQTEIPELKSMAADGLIVKGNLEVPFPYRTLGSQLEFAWKDISYSEFKLEDNRQKVISHQQTGKKHVVKVKITRDARDLTGKLTLPVKDKKFKKYLASGQYLETETKKIQELTKKILAGEKDAWQAAQKLLHWVYGYIHADLSPETLSTEQILASRNGKCVEYAILFTSLARTAGLPTRLVMGERYNGTIWVAHMWNEIWVGEWIAVDPSHNQIAPDALLLKFMDSETVLGVQKLRNSLTGNLELQINELKTEERINNLQTGIEKQLYTNATFEARATAPDGWEMVQAKENGVDNLMIFSLEQKSTQSILAFLTVPFGTTPNQVLEMRAPALEQILPQFTLIKKENLALAQGNAAVGTWTFTNQQGEKFRQENWIIIVEDRCFLWVFVAKENEWNASQKVFRQILDKFEIL